MTNSVIVPYLMESEILSSDVLSLFLFVLVFYFCC